MVIILFTVLAIAICFIVAGLLLSPRSPEPTPQELSYATRGSGARRTRVSQTAERQMRMRRAAYEFRPSPWSNVVGLLNVSRVFNPRMGDQTPWIGIALILIALFCVGTIMLRTLLPNSALILATSWGDLQPQSTPAAAAPAPKSNVDLFPGIMGASKALVRLGQLDPQQYASQKEFDTWAYSACSTASMTEVINSYGKNYRITQILQVESSIHAITPELGLLSPSGIGATVSHFGFNSTILNKPSIDDVLKIANNGRPVIVSFPPERWAGGHLLVVRGGNSSQVYLADSSKLNMQVMARSTFLKYWGGFATVVTPK